MKDGGVNGSLQLARCQVLVTDSFVLLALSCARLCAMSGLCMALLRFISALSFILLPEVMLVLLSPLSVLVYSGKTKTYFCVFLQILASFYLRAKSVSFVCASLM